ncbi:hypothetical protein [Leifsonia tongyongensis]|uniref:hypothetical protein n=1 Tax=Leifsonia tongyongensis TaxID=1268043 RepID=UPI001F045A64|nr:hypothetical protein [Diaminobutyricibacter tongyongensis]
MSRKKDSNVPANAPAAPGNVHQPTRKDRFRPVELLVISAILAVFVGLVVLMSTRQLLLASIFLGIAFIVALVGLAMFSLAFKPNAEEVSDLEEQNRGDDSTH